jgi:hypothetical protein
MCIIYTIILKLVDKTEKNGIKQKVTIFIVYR